MDTASENRGLRSSLLAKNTLAFLLATSVPLLLTFLVNTAFVSKTSKKVAIEHLGSVATMQKGRVEQFVRSYAATAKLISTGNALKTAIVDDRTDSKDGLKEYLRGLSERMRLLSHAIDRIVFVDNSWNVVAESNPAGTSTSVVNAEKQDGVSIVFADTEQIRIASPVVNGGKQLGHVILYYSFEEIREVVRDYGGVGESGETVLGALGPEEKVRFLSPLRFWKEGQPQLSSDLQARIPMSDALDGVEKDFFEDSIDYRGVPILAATRFIPGVKIGLVTKFDKAEALSEWNNLLYYRVTILLLTLLLATFVSVILGKALTKRITALTESVERLAKNYSAERAIVDSTDELGVLAERFNELFDRVNVARGALQNQLNEQKAVTDALRKSEEAVHGIMQELKTQKNELERLNIELSQEIEERKEAEQVAQRANDELRRSNNELDDFAYVASHDLKEPLRGLQNYASFLFADYGSKLDEEGKEMLESLVRLAKRLEILINSLLNYSRVAREEVAREPVDLNEVVRDVKDLISISIAENNVEIRIPRMLPTISAARVQVLEVFQNLVANAIKYNDKSEKWVEIGVAEERHPEKGTVLYIRDNGVGIPQKHKESVFKIFKRLRHGSQLSTGVGVGLTIAKKMVERHGGTIWLESEVGEGTTFYFSFGDNRDSREIHNGTGSDVHTVG